jgi:outer membrane lipoprotein-sorting protein
MTLRRAWTTPCAMAAALLLAPGGPIADAYSLAARATRFPRLETATAAFDQERQVSLVEDILHARGRLALKTPDTMRLELHAPESMTVVAQGSRVTLFDERGRAVPAAADLDALGRFARRLADLLLAGKAPGVFREQWSGPDEVTLVAADAASPYSEIQLRFPPDGPLPERIVLTERGGDRTTIHLHEIRLNPPLDAAALAAPPAAASPRSSPGGAK